MRNDLQVRLFAFAVNVIKFMKNFPNQPELSVIKNQLVKSATSSGAN